MKITFLTSSVLAQGGVFLGPTENPFGRGLVTTAYPIKINWEGQSPTDPCGSIIEIDDSLVNKTCIITYNFDSYIENVYRMYVGGGAFIVPDNVDGQRIITGYQGVSTDTRGKLRKNF